MSDPRCQQCDRPFRWNPRNDNDVPPPTCGAPPCRARQTWGPEDWAGRARMATARLNAHGPDALDDLDREALDRASTSST